MNKTSHNSQNKNRKIYFSFVGHCATIWTKKWKLLFLTRGGGVCISLTRNNSQLLERKKQFTSKSTYSLYWDIQLIRAYMISHLFIYQLQVFKKYLRISHHNKKLSNWKGQQTRELTVTVYCFAKLAQTHVLFLNNTRGLIV